MPTIHFRSGDSLLHSRRGVLHSVSWQIQPNVWSPPTDVYETEAATVVRVEIAGMREQDFEVILENDQLYISGTRTDLRERRAYHQMEIHFGKFATAVLVPRAVDVERAHAEYTDGFLIVTLPDRNKPPRSDR